MSYPLLSFAMLEGAQRAALVALENDRIGPAVAALQALRDAHKQFAIAQAWVKGGPHQMIGWKK